MSLAKRDFVKMFALGNGFCLPIWPQVVVASFGAKVKRPANYYWQRLSTLLDGVL